MIRNALLMGVVLSLVVGACAPEATPTFNPLDIQHTAEAGALTIVAQTQAAVPTDTVVPPTDTPPPTSPPTLTPLASPTSGTLAAATATATVAAQSSGSASSTQDACNKALTAWEGPTAKLNLANETKPKGTVTLSLSVVTERGECGFLSSQFETNDSISGPVGQYVAFAFVDGQKNFQVSGAFRITQGSWTIVVKNESIVAQGGCFPNC